MWHLSTHRWWGSPAFLHILLIIFFLMLSIIPLFKQTTMCYPFSCWRVFVLFLVFSNKVKTQNSKTILESNLRVSCKLTSPFIDQDGFNIPLAWLNFRKISSWYKALLFLRAFVLEKIQLKILPLPLRGKLWDSLAS